MNQISDLKETLTTPSKKRNCIFIGIGVFVLLLIIIIIIAVTAGKSKSKNPFESYLSAKKYLYVWNYPNAENFIKFLVDHKYSKVYLYVGCVQWDLDNLIVGNIYSAGDTDAKELIKKLIEKKIEVELCIYLNDSPNNFANVDKMPEIAKAMAEVQKTLKFTALHFDVEPQNNENLEALLHMYEECRKYIKVSAILKPDWLNKNMADLKSYFTSADYYNQFKDCETFVDAIMTVTDYTDLMAYDNTYEGVDIYLNKFQTIKKRHKSNVAKPVLELDPTIVEEGLYPRYKEDKDKFLKYFVDVSKKFDGVTMHQYEAWYDDLYCEAPKKDSTYYFGKPKQC